jgi:hypothetical protein
VEQVQIDDRISSAQFPDHKRGEGVEAVIRRFELVRSIILDRR